MPKIGLDYTAAVHQSAGIGRYVRELVNALANKQAGIDYRLFVADGPPDPPSPVGNGVGDGQKNRGAAANIWHYRATRLSRRWLERLWYRLQLPLPIEVWTGAVNLFHAPDFVLPPTLPGTRTLVTIHDLSFVRLPQFTMPGMSGYLNRWVPYSVKQADHVIAVSEATKQDLIELYHTPPEKISVLYHGISSDFSPNTDRTNIQRIRQKYRLNDSRFILSVGTVQPRKNYQRLVQAFAPLAHEQPDLLLLIVGGAGWQSENIYHEVERLNLSKQVRFLGFVDEADLPTLYQTAALFAYPSLYEGFGLPALEALACGTPVVAANGSALPEVVGSAGLLVDPLDTVGLTEAMRRVLLDGTLHETLSQQGVVQAQQFSWARMAEDLVKLYEALLGA